MERYLLYTVLLFTLLFTYSRVHGPRASAQHIALIIVVCRLTTVRITFSITIFATAVVGTWM